MTGAPTVLLVPSNGVGLGHVTRAAAIGRSLLEQGVTPILCTLSPVIAPFRDLGLLVEHLPSYRRTALPRWHWQRVLAAHVSHLTKVYGVGAVVFDGVAPYRGIQRAMARDDAPPYVWVRRGRRREASTAVARDRLDAGFRLVIQPGEVDRGLATPAHAALQLPPRTGPGNRAAVIDVPPIMLHRRGDLLDRVSALDSLGWDPADRYALVSLGTGAQGALAQVEHEACAGLAARGLVPVVARSPLVPGIPGPPGARLLRRYPLTPLLPAFDVIVIAAGYNSVAEVLLSDVPAILIPNPDAATDDQNARATAVARDRLAAVWVPSEGASLDQTISAALEPATANAQRATREGWIPPSGAEHAAAAIIGVI